MNKQTYRAQILLEPEQHRTLARIASQEGQSILDVIQQILHRELAGMKPVEAPELTRGLPALEHIRQHRAAILARRDGQPLNIDVVTMVQQMREERDDYNLAGIINYRS